MDRIARVLELMGSTPDLVAATLRGAHIRGVPYSTSYRNPIVRYLKQTLDLGAYLELGPGGATLLIYQNDRILEIDLPEPVRGFLDRFHGGAYPEITSS
ncbi:MAG: hypothetical protein IRY99_12275 [Isosphaeraceae bacterium]|nr:hypothetical protein [Isosphaeraceae bacterium]